MNERVIADPVSLGVGAFREFPAVAQLLADDEIRRLDAMAAQNVQNLRCDFRIWPVIETQRDHAHASSSTKATPSGHGSSGKDCSENQYQPRHNILGELLSDSQIAAPDLVVRLQFVRARREDDASFAHDVDVVDELENEMRILLDKQDRHPLALEMADCFPQALNDDGHKTNRKNNQEQTDRI